MTELYLVALAVMIVGALVLWWAQACRRGTFRRNAILGYRTPLTLTNNDAWIAVHKAIAPFALIAGAGAVLGAVVAALLAALHVGSVSQVLLGISVGWIVLWILLGIIPAHIAARNFKKTHASAD